MGVNTCEVGVVTEPECLGPCEPGTSVNLEGIVWHETEEGKLFFLLGLCLRYVGKGVYALSAWALAKGLLIFWDTIMCYGNYSFTVQLVSFYFKNK